MKKSLIMGPLLIAVLLGAGRGSCAEDVHGTGLHITPYAWLPLEIDVDSTVEGVTVPINLDLGDIFDNFDVFAASVRAEYWWGQWGAVVDGMWVDLDSKGLSPGIPFIDKAEVDIAEGLLDMLAAYRFNTGDNGTARLMAGLRYHYLKQEITLSPTLPQPKTTVGTSKDWLELLIAAQYVHDLGEHWLITARSDLSGFGIGSGSDITASVMGGVGYKITPEWVAKLGYRYYYIDYSNGSGTDEFGLDGNMHGPWLGIAYIP